MLGRTAGGLFWMFRLLERAENMARLVEAGFRIALTRASSQEGEWASLLRAAGVDDRYRALHERVERGRVVDFMLRERASPSSIASLVEQARTNARLVRTALSREVWEATNDAWLTLTAAFDRPVDESALPAVLAAVRQQGALVRGALQGTMLRNDVYNFARLGTFVERADSTARILDVKYYVLLPSVASVGTAVDNAQWETVLRALSAHRAYTWLHRGEVGARPIARFVILDRRLPRSLAFCHDKLRSNLGYLAADYGERRECHAMVDAVHDELLSRPIERIVEDGLHEYIGAFLARNAAIARQIEADYRFTG